MKKSSTFSDYKGRWRNSVPVNNKEYAQHVDGEVKVLQFIKVAKQATLEDGRIIEIQEWHPHVAVDDVIKVTISGVVRKPIEVRDE